MIGFSMINIQMDFFLVFKKYLIWKETETSKLVKYQDATKVEKYSRGGVTTTMNSWMWMVRNETDIVMTPWFLAGHTAPAARMQRSEFWVLIYLLLLKLLF